MQEARAAPFRCEARCRIMARPIDTSYHRGLAKALVITLRTRSYNYIVLRYIDFMAFASANFFSRSVHSLCAEPIRGGVGDQDRLFRALDAAFWSNAANCGPTERSLRDEFDRAFPVYNGLFS